MRAVFVQVWQDLRLIGRDVVETYRAMWRASRRLGGVGVLFMYTIHLGWLLVGCAALSSF